MSVERERLSRLRDMAWELHEFADEVLREFDREEDAATGRWVAELGARSRPLRSVADLRDDAAQARAEHHGDIA